MNSHNATFFYYHLNNRTYRGKLILKTCSQPTNSTLFSTRSTERNFVQKKDYDCTIWTSIKSWSWSIIVPAGVSCALCTVSAILVAHTSSLSPSSLIEYPVY